MLNSHKKLLNFPCHVLFTVMSDVFGLTMLLLLNNNYPNPLINTFVFYLKMKYKGPDLIFCITKFYSYSLLKRLWLSTIQVL